MDVNQGILGGRRALVTGGAGAIGAATVIALATAGADVVVNHLGTAEAAAKVAEAAGAAGVRAVAIEADIAREAAVADLFTAAEAALGGIDILVNCAGIARPEDIFATTLASWNEIIGVNLTGPFLTCRAALPGMRDRRYGRIVNIASVVAHRGHLLGQVHYGASKAGLIGLTKTLARTAAPFGVTVNAVAPGIVETPLLRRTHTAEEIAALAQRAPLAGLLVPEEIAGAVLYLCSPAAARVTGTCLDVDGGERMR
jgi:3-oxoacyl-[acyl-carrier protein] reductase